MSPLVFRVIAKREAMFTVESRDGPPVERRGWEIELRPQIVADGMERGTVCPPAFDTFPLVTLSEAAAAAYSVGEYVEWTPALAPAPTPTRKVELIGR